MILLVWLLLALQGPALPSQGTNQVYHSQPGDTLLSVARRYRLGLEHVAWANGRPIDLKALPVSNYRIPLRRIPPVPLTDGLVLNLPERGVYAFQGPKCVGFYPVAIGMPGWDTPTGSFTIHDRTINPTWYPPSWAGETAPVGPGPANPLGDRWMGLGLRGYGMHATNRPDSIGGALSHGCIRMYPELARELYDRVRVGTPVRIEYLPVKVAWDDQTFTASLAVFPDVYHRCQLAAEARRVLSDAQLLDWVEPKHLAEIVSKSTGFTESISGEQIQVSTATGETKGFPGARWRGRLHCTPELLEAVGLRWQRRGQQLLIEDVSRQYPADYHNLQGHPMVEILPVLEFFGLTDIAH